MSSKISGIGLKGLEKRSILAHKNAFDNNLFTLPIGGFYRYRKGGEQHSFDASSIHMLQSSVGIDSYKIFKKYSAVSYTHLTLPTKA